MNKDKFLKELEKKLAVLSEDERNDTINEYRDIIEEKVKHGKTEEEAVKEFGNVSELAKEILSTYKINPEYSKNETKEKTKQIMDDCEVLIKKGAQKLSDVTEEVIDNFKETGKDFTLENAFEIVIKVFIVLVLLAVLRIPFSLLSSFGSHIFADSFPFFGDWLFRFAWKFIVEIVYLGVCVLLVLAAVNQYIGRGKKIQPRVKKESTYKNETENKSSSVKVSETKEHSENVKKKQPMKDDAISTLLLIIVKMFVILIFLLPLWCMMFGLIIAVGFIIWLIVKGVAVWGILLLLFGILGFVSWLAGLLYNAVFRNKMPHIFPIFFNFFLIVIGAIMTFDYVTSFKYYDHIPNDIKTKVEVLEETVDKSLYIEVDEKKFIIDNSLEDNSVKIEMSYYPEYATIHHSNYGANEQKHLTIYTNSDYKVARHSFNDLIRYLKNKEWYRFEDLGDAKATIYVNEKTKDLVH